MCNLQNVAFYQSNAAQTGHYHNVYDILGFDFPVFVWKYQRDTISIKKLENINANNSEGFRWMYNK